MQRISIYIISIIFLFQSCLLAYSSDPKDFINELVNDAISKLSDKNLDKDQKAKFIEEIALENVDINALGLYTLGELRKSSSENDISNYKNSFEKYFLKSLTSRLTDYSSSKFEIINAIKKIKKNNDKINEKNLSKYLETKNIPDPELLIRTGNTNRLSNFLLWQLAYTEIFFEKKLWPEFNEKDFIKIIRKFKKIKRNFGTI